MAGRSSPHRRCHPAACNVINAATTHINIGGHIYMQRQPGIDGGVKNLPRTEVSASPFRSTVIAVDAQVSGAPANAIVIESRIEGVVSCKAETAKTLPNVGPKIFVPR